jgi:hypothetical protein
MRFFDPFDLMRPGLEAFQILAEAQTVIGLRLAGLAGIWPMGRAETEQMVCEKLEAGLDAGNAALRAGMAGASPSDVVMAAMAPVRKKTRANAKRLQHDIAQF